MVWQIPLGNTKMRAKNNTWGHYQDNRAEWFLEDPGGTHLALGATPGSWPSFRRWRGRHDLRLRREKATA